jgi:hypothetical protein
MNVGILKNWIAKIEKRRRSNLLVKMKSRFEEKIFIELDVNALNWLRLKSSKHLIRNMSRYEWIQNLITDFVYILIYY